MTLEQIEARIEALQRDIEKIAGDLDSLARLIVKRNRGKECR